jgi:cyclophilin family peptidyl-prolyl cis-trans isomerase
MLVLPFATDPDPAVRAQAAMALGRIGDKSALPTVRALAADPDARVAEGGIFAWALLGGDGLDEPAAMAAMGRRPEAGVRGAAAFAFGFAGKEANFHFCVDVFLRDSDAPVRGEAALAIAKFLNDRNQRKTPTWEGLALRAIAALATAGSQEKDPEVRWRLAYALAATSRPEAGEAILAFTKDPNWLARLFAARGLGRRAGTDAARAALIELSRDSEARVACESACGAREPRGGEIFAAYAELLGRKETFVRCAALRAFTRGDASQYLDVALGAIDRGDADPDPWVRGDALVARAAVRAPDAAARVEKGLADPTAAIRIRAAEAAGYLPTKEAIVLLAKALADPNYLVASAGAKALGRVDDEAARAMLRTALTHGRGLVREDAAEALQAQAQHSADLAADVRALLESLGSARGADMAEPRATLIAALADVEARRREAAQKIVNPAEADLRTRLEVALLDCASDPDPTVRAKAAAAWTRLLSETPEPKVGIPPPPEPVIPGGNAPAFRRAPRARIQTNRGAFVVSLFGEVAPVHVENFLRLAEAKFYDGTPWHRVEFNFVVQGGDHLGDGTGARPASGGTLRDELSPRPYRRGTLGMPKTDVVDSGGSQLFVSVIPTPHLDARYTAFGQVEEGLEVLDALEIGDRIDSVEILDRGN